MECGCPSPSPGLPQDAGGGMGRVSRRRHLQLQNLEEQCTCPALLRDSRTVQSSMSWSLLRHPGKPRIVLGCAGLAFIAVVMICSFPTYASAERSLSSSGLSGGQGASSSSSRSSIAMSPTVGFFTQSEDRHRHQQHHGVVPSNNSSSKRAHRHSHRPKASSHQRPKNQWTQVDDDDDDFDDEEVSLSDLDYDENSTPPSRPSCSSCRMREEIRNISLDSIKEQILHKLNLQQAPNITGRKIPSYAHISEILGAYPRHSSLGSMSGMQGDDPGAFRPGPEIFEEDDDFHAKTERVIAFAQPHPKLRHRWRGHNVLHFRFSAKVMQNQVSKATLWLWVRGTGSSTSLQDEDDEDTSSWGETVTINVTRMQRGGGMSSSQEIPPFHPEMSVKLARPDGKGGWVTLDLTKLVEDWFKRPRDNVGLVVFATDSSGKQLIVTDPNEQDGTLVPFVEVYLTDGRKRRIKRNMGLNCKENSEESRCCRYPLTVDFEAFGWDFIIAPKKYEANYCSGECPYVFMQKYPHTALVHMANRDAGPCCAPRKMSSITMLYFDNEFNIVYGLLPGMVVDRCGCS